MAEDIIFQLFSLSENSIFFALVGGILPALFWLWFWLREDTEHPEPRSLIFWTFVAGMLTTAVVLPLEKLAMSIISSGIILVAIWSVIEEVAKYLTTHFVALKQRFFDEPIDALIYLITCALGFSAMENFLFILKTVSESGPLDGFLIGNIRFVGASLLHIVASSFVGGAIALTFYSGKTAKTFALIIGIIGATALHTIFNLSIIQGDNEDLFKVLLFVWTLVIALILFFQKIKKSNNNI